MKSGLIKSRQDRLPGAAGLLRLILKDRGGLVTGAASGWLQCLVRPSLNEASALEFRLCKLCGARLLLGR